MAKRMLIDATHPEETRVVVQSGHRLEEFDFETSTKKQVKGNIYLAKITRVEPSLQAAFVDFGGNRHGFLAFSEIHPDYYRIPVGDRGPAREERGERREYRRDDEPHRDDDQRHDDLSEGEPRLAAPEAEDRSIGGAAPVADDRAAQPPSVQATDEAAPAPDTTVVPLEESQTTADAGPLRPAEPAPEEAGDRDYAEAERSTAEAISAPPLEA